MFARNSDIVLAGDLELALLSSISRLRACSSLKQADVFDRDDRLVGEGLQQFNLVVGELPGSARVTAMTRWERLPAAWYQRPLRKPTARDTLDAGTPDRPRRRVCGPPAAQDRPGRPMGRLGRTGYARCTASRASGVKYAGRPDWISSAVELKELAEESVAPTSRRF